MIRSLGPDFFPNLRAVMGSHNTQGSLFQNFFFADASLSFFFQKFQSSLTCDCGNSIATLRVIARRRRVVGLVAAPLFAFYVLAAEVGVFRALSACVAGLNEELRIAIKGWAWAWGASGLTCDRREAVAARRVVAGRVLRRRVFGRRILWRRVFRRRWVLRRRVLRWRVLRRWVLRRRIVFRRWVLWRRVLRRRILRWLVGLSRVLRRLVGLLVAAERLSADGFAHLFGIIDTRVCRVVAR